MKMRTPRMIGRIALLLILFMGGYNLARPGVMITGILDGTLTGGCPKAIELFITGTENLNYYEIWRSLNGAPFGEGSGAISSLSGVYTNTFVYLVKTDHVNAFHDVFGNEGIFANVLPLGIISGNGNDGFQVRQKVGSVVIDQVWLEDETYSYADSYWYRKHGTGPDGGWLPSNWETPGNDVLDGLDEAGLQAAVPFGTYAVMWNGLTTAWSDSANWSTGVPPSFQTNVIIPDTAGIYPVIANPPANPAVCMNLTVMDTARLTVGAGKALTVYGNLSLDTLAAGETERGLLLESDSGSAPTGSMILFGEPSGTTSIECFLAKNNDWHFLSSPVEGQLLQPEFVPVPLDQTFDFYYWDETALLAEGWINIRSAGGQWNPQFENWFIPAKGYLVAYSSSNSGEMTRIFTGMPNSGSMDIPMGYSGNYRNLLGNPYSCALDWSSAGISKEIIAAGAMYIWDPALNEGLGGYRSHNGTTGVPAGTTSIIPAMQGFFVQTLDTGHLSVDISNDNPLVHSGLPYYKSRRELTEERIRLKVTRGLLSDETLIYFDPGASNNFDPAYDAAKFFNDHPGSPEIYSIAGPGHHLCINILSNHPVSVPLGISHTTEDTLTIAGFDFDGVPGETGIFLEDSRLDSLINLRENPEYRFFHNPYQSESHLTLHFMNAAVLQTPICQDKYHFWYANNHIYSSNPENISGEMALYTIDGRCLQIWQIPSGDYASGFPLPKGVYILKVFSHGWMDYRKICIN
jgi:hypothetical protein